MPLSVAPELSYLYCPNVDILRCVLVRVEALRFVLDTDKELQITILATQHLHPWQIFHA